MDKKRVLLAEDDEDLREMLVLYLGNMNCEVVPVEDGTAALTTGREQRFDLVVTDVMMPGLTGYHVAQQLSEALGPACPKILIMTSRDTQKESGLARLSGASATLQKPFKMADFKAKVSELLGDPAVGK
ncbi:response regulator [Elusimicrobiota bacterium]